MIESLARTAASLGWIGGGLEFTFDMTGNSAACLSAGGSHRYGLFRSLGGKSATDRPVVFCMLNPSTADAMNNDPTLRRCMAFALSFGCRSLYVVNLFAWRATDPKQLQCVEDAVGSKNDELLAKLPSDWPVVVGWGKDKAATPERVRAVLALLNRDVQCLATNKDGSPGHPLFLPGTSALREWKPLQSGAKL